MKFCTLFILSFCGLLFTKQSAAQWTTSSNDIYNSNSGNVGVGITSPAVKFHVNGLSRFENGTNTSAIITAYRSGVSLLEIRASEKDGYANLFIGKDAGANADPSLPGYTVANNVGLGNLSLGALTTGFHNAATGFYSLSATTTGNFNSAFGSIALMSLVTGEDNTAIGQAAMYEKTSGNANTAVGTNAGQSNLTGSSNTFIGKSSGLYNTGSYNTFLGRSSGANSGSGNYNVIIGNNDGYAINGLSNHIIVADGQGNERLKINNSGAYSIGGAYGTSGQILTSNGNASAPTWQTFTSLWTDAGSGSAYNTSLGNVGIGTSTPAYKLDVVGTAKADSGYFAYKLGIGTVNNLADYKLAVKGNIIAEKVKVKLQSTGWPDYVFHQSYDLPTLKEVEQFIKENNHLPGVPSATDVEKDGLDLGNGQAILLRKIEEMTLYMIEMNKKIDKLTEENEAMKKRLDNNHNDYKH